MLLFLRRTARALPLLVSLLLLLPATAQSQTVVWTREFGTNRSDEAFDAAADSSGVYVVGETDGNLGDQQQHGGGDAFIRRYSGGGAVRWTRSFANTQNDTANAVAIEGADVVMGGSTGSLGDAFLAEYDSSGNLLWTDEFGSANGLDSILSIAADSTGIYVAADASQRLSGLTYHGGSDVVVRRYDLDGHAVWTKEIGTKGDDVSGSVALDGAGGLYATFTTTGAVPGTTNAGFNDIVVRRYDLNGNATWTRQFGTGNDEQEFAAVADGSGVYVGGTTRDPLSGPGDLNALLFKFRPKGALAWTTALASASDDYLFDLSITGRRLFAAGEADGDLPGHTSAGGEDGFLAEYEPSGAQDWVGQFGTAGNDVGWGVGASNGRAFVVGQAGGALNGSTFHGGTYDAYVMKFV